MLQKNYLTNYPASRHTSPHRCILENITPFFAAKGKNFPNRRSILHITIRYRHVDWLGADPVQLDRVRLAVAMLGGRWSAVALSRFSTGKRRSGKAIKC